MCFQIFTPLRKQHSATALNTSRKQLAIAMLLQSKSNGIARQKQCFYHSISMLFLFLFIKFTLKIDGDLHKKMYF